MRKIGLKVWSVNSEYISEAERIYKDGVCDFIEIYAVSDSFKIYGEKWKKINAPFIIHAPHYKDGVNLALYEKREFNKIVAEESKRFADLLGSEKIIFHPGAGGNIDEVIFQLKRFNDERILIENKPYLGIGGKIIFHGASFEDIEKIIKESNVKFCLDFGHAICAANSFKINQIEFLKKLNTLFPAMYHLTDGDYTGEMDTHKNYGTGNFPLREIIKIIPDKSLVTNEAAKKYKDSLRDFDEDVKIFKKLEN